MMAFIAALGLIGCVVALIKAFGLWPKAQQVLRISRSAIEVMRDPVIGDDRKESLLQGYSLSLLRAFPDLLLRGIGVMAIPVGLLWALQWAGILSLSAVWDLVVSWPFLVSGTLASAALVWFFER